MKKEIEQVGRIPKVFHYVWLGKSEKPESVKRCIESWKKYCPDFQIMEWNEDNFDINSNIFVQEAIKHKKWAFASDYIRLVVLAKYGGIYLDTDVEILKDFSPLLENEAFFGFEHKHLLQSATFGCTANHPFVMEFLDLYKKRHFEQKNGHLDTTPNTEYLTVLLQHKYSMKVDNSFQKLREGIVIFPRDYFSPKDFMTRKVHATENTFSIHHFDGTWLEENTKKGNGFLGKVVGHLNSKVVDSFAGMYYRPHLKKIWKRVKKLQSNSENLEKRK